MSIGAVTHDEGDRIACPHGCGHLIRDLWDFNWAAPSEVKDTVLLLCEGCGKSIDLKRHESVSYTATAT